ILEAECKHKEDKNQETFHNFREKIEDHPATSQTRDFDSTTRPCGENADCKGSSRKDSLRRHLNNIHIKHSPVCEVYHVADQPPSSSRTTITLYGPDEGVCREASEIDKKDKNSISEPLAVHSNVKLFECPQCTKRFSFRYSLNKHSKIHAKDTNKTQKSQCTQRPENPIKKEIVLLKRHMKIHVDPAKNAKKPQKPRFADDKIVEADVSRNRMKNMETCSTVGKNVGPSSDSKPGISTHKNDACENADGVGKKSTAKTVRADVVDKDFKISRRPFECQICSSSFIKKRNLKSHLAVHNVKLFECPQCTKRFSFRYLLNRHSKIHAKDTNKSQKSQCTQRPEDPIKKVKTVKFAEDVNMPSYHLSQLLLGQVGTFAKQLRVYVDNGDYAEAAKEGKEPQNKDSKQGHHLMYHMSVHSNEKPFECPQCNNRFSRKSTLNRHMKIHVDSAKNAKKPQKSRFTEATVRVDGGSEDHLVCIWTGSYYADTAKDVKRTPEQGHRFKEEVKPRGGNRHITHVDPDQNAKKPRNHGLLRQSQLKSSVKQGIH
ncbi:gastrula zinc finger protein XlCGF57.1-like, partial [Penaeus monodon]|uniref:gastrula zinc finger protein XlCGF57.1-like n=1 Tax=Penaeus monodon TaxID=6687 RepID=UPI0018A6E8C6